MKEMFNFNELPDTNNRFLLGECIGEGVHAKVFKAKDTETEENVAVKVQNFNDENVAFIQEEFRILQNFSNHPNLLQFYGIYKNTGELGDEVWFVMELCEGGPVMDLVRGINASNRRMAEEHVSLILKEVLKALTYLHENNIMHRDIKGSNVLLTKEGDIKLADFGLSRVLKSSLGKTYSCLGSPNWMAPEVITVQINSQYKGYDGRADVWSLGILALELSNGKSPYEDMHPTRAIFQIARNPPPTLDIPGNWSDIFKDFIDECLVKNPDHRPFMVELQDHPFFELVPTKYYYLNQELKMLNETFGPIGRESRRPETVINTHSLKKGYNKPMEQMLVEDLSALEEIGEEVVLQELSNRAAKGQSYTFAGDVLLALNPNEQQDIYGEKQHSEYQFKSRSDCAPHIFTVADSAYQAALHHDKTQHIILTGESSSGKTANFLHVINHLLYLGKNENINQERIKNAIKLIHAFIHASTPSNDYSTRAVFHTEINYGSSGKNTGAHFEVYQIEKWRISSSDDTQPNFHILYYFYDGIQENGELNKYLLKDDRQCRYLRIPPNSNCNSRPRDNPKSNAKKYQKILEILKEFEFDDEQIQSILNTLAAIITLGDITFSETTDNNTAEIVNKDYARKVGQLLKIEEENFISGLNNSHDRDVLANTLYSRVLQYIVNVINDKLSYGRAIFGDKYSVKVLDFYGFESFKANNFSQFLVNCTNEQIQYFYNQAIFAWEELDSIEENVPYQTLSYYNNKTALDEMLGSFSALALIEEAAKGNKDGSYVVTGLKNQIKTFVKNASQYEFCSNHYAGSVTYDASSMPSLNRDNLPVKIVQLLRTTNDAIIKTFFTSKLNKMGNICMCFDQEGRKNITTANEKYVQKNLRQFSQTAKLYTAARTFKASSLELMKELSISARFGGAHFVRCLRSDFTGNSKSFHKELVKQQLRALAVVETATVRKNGFSHRIPFSEFLKRYKFLAFDFGENIEASKDNCRLLLIRLHMENWAIGRTKVFLKYYHEEYLARLYEKQVIKIIKIQSLIRSYLIKRKLVKTLKMTKKESEKDQNDLIREEAAIIVQKAYRNYYGRKHHNDALLDNDSSRLISYFFNKWRRKSVYQVLLQYRASQYQDLYNLSQQVHLYNQYVINELNTCSNVDLKHVESSAQIDTWLGETKSSVLKLPFRLDDIPFYDTIHMCNFTVNRDRCNIDDEENWDSPFNLRDISETSGFINSKDFEERVKLQLTKLPFNRQPSEFTPLSNEIDSSKLNFEEQRSKLKKVEKKLCSEIEHLNSINNNNTTKSANKDFEYIKAPILKKSPKTKDDYVNPINELESRGRRKGTADEDEPPFNFQAMLRKTNYRRENDDTTKAADFDQDQKLKKDTEKCDDDKIISNVEKESEKYKVTFEDIYISTEIASGITLEGVLVDL